MTSLRPIALLIVVTTLAGCQARGQDESRGEGQRNNTIAAVEGVPSCHPGRDPDLSLKARKVRVARGVYRASRRIAVDGELELWDTPYGRWWVVADNFNTFSEVLGEQAVEIYGDKDRGVHEGDVVLDSGAHFGGFTRAALNRGAKLVVAIEIAPENAQVLRKNFAPEIAAGRVIVYEKGVWDKDDTLVLARRNHTWADQVVASGPGPSVALTTVDKIVEELRLRTVDFIKMDIEGAERNALAGASGTLKTYKPRMAIAAYHEPDDVQVLTPLVLTAQPVYTACLSGLGLGRGYMTLFFR